ncbi:Uma2 family endonuclease [Pseudanabaena sp. UWO310]|uniref:Uma2 family endonuclease n=1 Tax=Pseudanabaena sp. UWO310 TaxID=2480795 RepID=UPI00115BF564|nr:Uma2 family endonuclease [Pseudanabaena sp. UWO310]TYQ29874.1 Uma2 family endonuclease [Pseudanabaena sp. UWO310]
MISATLSPSLSPTEYLDWEVTQEGRYEYEYGEVIEVTGGKLENNEIALNLIVLLRSHLRGQGCRILGGDAKLMTIPSNVYYFPDVVVSCDSRDRNAREFLQYPCLIAEVLSPATENRDRGIKLRNYLKIDSLQEYMLINSDSPSIEFYRRSDRTEVWEYLTINSSDLSINDPEVQLTSIDLSLPLSLIYENIDFQQS